MNESFWDLITTGTGFALTLMVFVWLLAKRLNNAGIVDVAWGIVSALLAVIYFFASGDEPGDPVRRGIICAMAAIAQGRLGLFLWRRVAKHHPEEDGRYAALREQYPHHPWLMFLGFFLLQGLLIVLLSAPIAIACANPAIGLGAWEYAGAGLWLVAMLGEALSDHQLNTFRSQSGNKGKTCQLGLWHYSRHPNYFFQWLLWVSYFVFALGTPDGWITIYCPALMLFFLTKVTGIPPTEAQALKSRGDEYREYQRTTSAFVPWFPKSK